MTDLDLLALMTATPLQGVMWGSTPVMQVVVPLSPTRAVRLPVVEPPMKAQLPVLDRRVLAVRMGAQVEVTGLAVHRLLIVPEL